MNIIEQKNFKTGKYFRSVSPHLRLSSAQEFSDYSQLVLNRRPDLERPQTVPKVILEALEQTLGGEPDYDNFYGQLCHPLVSPYTNSLLLKSSLPQVKEDFWDIRTTEVTLVKAESNKTIRAVVDVDRISVLGRHIFIQSLCQLQFVEKKVRLDKKRLVEFIVFNTRSCDVTVGKNEIIGIAQSNQSFPFPQSQFKTCVKDILKSPTVSPNLLKSPTVSPKTLKSPTTSSDILLKSPQLSSAPKKRVPLPGDWASSSKFVSDLETAHQTVVPSAAPSDLLSPASSLSVYAPPKEIREAKNIPEIFENQPRKRFEPSASVSSLYARGKSDLHDPIESTDKTDIPLSSASKQIRDPRKILLKKKKTTLVSKPLPSVGKITGILKKTPPVVPVLPPLQSYAEIPTLPKSSPPPSSSEHEAKRPEVPEVGQILLLEDLDPDISEAEIRMKISLEQLPRADSIRLRAERRSTTAILHFQRSSQAKLFRRSLDGRFLSNRRNIFIGRQSDLDSSGEKEKSPRKTEKRERTSSCRRKSFEETSSPKNSVENKKLRKDNPEIERSGNTEGKAGGTKRSPGFARGTSLQSISCYRVSVDVETLVLPSQSLDKSSTATEPQKKSSAKSKSFGKKPRPESDKAEQSLISRTKPDKQKPGHQDETDTVSHRIMEMQEIINNSKKFKKDFYKMICTNKFASAKAPAISPPAIKRRKVKSEKWIKKDNFDEDQQHSKRKLSDDETETDSKRPRIETNVEVINLSEEGEETDLDSSITVEEFKIENIDQYSDHQLEEEMTGGIKTENKSGSESGVGENSRGTLESCPTPVSVPRKKPTKRSLSAKKVACFSTKKAVPVCEWGRVAVSNVNLDQVEDILDIVSFVCQTCSKSFLSLPGLKSHVTRMHKENYTKESCLNGISNYIIETDPLVPQVKSLSENLQRLAVNDDNLALQFSILLTFPQFNNLIKTFLRFYQKPINNIQQELKEFADCLLRYNG